LDALGNTGLRVDCTKDNPSTGSVSIKKDIYLRRLYRYAQVAKEAFRFAIRQDPSTNTATLETGWVYLYEGAF
jgi:hypothetical protein